MRPRHMTTRLGAVGLCRRSAPSPYLAKVVISPAFVLGIHILTQLLVRKRRNTSLPRLILSCFGRKPAWSLFVYIPVHSLIPRCKRVLSWKTHAEGIITRLALSMEFTAASRPSVSISPSLVLDDSDNSSSNPQQGPMKGFSAADSSAAVSMEKSFQSIAVDVVPDFAGPTPRNDKTTTHSFTSASTRRTGPRMSMKIPATSKDSRKLFVGGLPMDGA